MLISNRINITEIQAALNAHADSNPDRTLVILVDFPFSMDRPNCEIIDIASSFTPEQLAEYNNPSSQFIYAVDQDDAGTPFVQWLADNSIKFYPVFQASPARYVNKDIRARLAIEEEYIYQTSQQFAKFDFGFGDFENICQALQATRDLDGAYVEVGCFQGSSGGVAMRYMHEAGIFRPAWFLDVFDGFSYDAAETSADAIWNQTHASDGISAVSDRLSRFADPSHGRPVNVRKSNIITDELPAEIGAIAVANLDVDMLEAVHQGLIRLAPRVAVGGILIVEDPGHTPLLVGAQVAFDMFMKLPKARSFVPVYMQSGQYFLIRVLITISAGLEGSRLVAFSHLLVG